MKKNNTFLLICALLAAILTLSGSARNPAIGAAMKKVYFRAKEQAEQIAGAEYEEAEAYAYEEAETNAAEILETTVDVAKNGAGKVIRSERERIKTRRTAVEIKKEAESLEAAETAVTFSDGNPHVRSLRNAKRQRIVLPS